MAGKRKFDKVLVVEKKQWVENQVIVLSDTDVCDIGLSLFDIGIILFDKLVAYGKENNIR